MLWRLAPPVNLFLIRFRKVSYCCYGRDIKKSQEVLLPPIAAHLLIYSRSQDNAVTFLFAKVCSWNERSRSEKTMSLTR